MGVTGLWKHLDAASQEASFEKVALRVFDNARRDLARGEAIDTNRRIGLRVGIDASGWFFHSYETEGGANPELRTLFHRIIRLVKTGALVLFVFDGPHRPNVKRGNRIWRGEHSFETPLIRIIEALGCEWRRAPGEAEAELAMLNRTGVLDTIISDDVDSFLFGALSVHRNALLANVTKENYPRVYKAEDIHLQAELSVPGLILIALMAGGDYDQSGLTGVGPKISMGLAKGGYGERLANAIRTYSGGDLDKALHSFREDIRHQMRTNEAGLFDRKAGAVANKIPDTWPDVKTAQRYYTPITSALSKYASFSKHHTWSGTIDIGELTQICDELFEFTHAEILQKFRNLLWHCVVVEQLVRSLQAAASHAPTVSDTPSKHLARAINKLGVGSVSSKGKGRASGFCMPEEMQDVFYQVTKARTYNPGKKVTQEVQLVIQPLALVERVRQHLRQPDPNIGKLQARKAEEAALIAAQHGPDAPGAVPAADRNSKFDNPEEDLKLWVQQSLLEMAWPELIEDWEERERLKAEGKLKKGKGKKSPAKTKTKTKPTPSGAVAVAKKQSGPEKSVETDTEDELFASAFSRPGAPPTASTSRIPPPPVREAPRPAQRRPREASQEDSDSDIELISSTANPVEGKAKVEKAIDTAKSPKKSPRKSKKQTTARDGMPAIDATDGDVPVKTKTKAKAKTPPTVLYAPISDSSEDEAGPSRMSKPPVLSFAKVKAQQQTAPKPSAKAAAAIASSGMRPSLSGSSTSSANSASSTATPSDGGPPASSRPATKIAPTRKADVSSRAKLIHAKKEVIDLCSSD